MPIDRVEVLLDGAWHGATLSKPVGRYAWTHWQIDWQAMPGIHTLISRATDAEGNTQPMNSSYDVAGFGNNSVHRIEVHVAEATA